MTDRTSFRIERNDKNPNTRSKETENKSTYSNLSMRMNSLITIRTKFSRHSTKNLLNYSSIKAPNNSRPDLSSKAFSILEDLIDSKYCENI